MHVELQMDFALLQRAMQAETEAALLRCALDQEQSENSHLRDEVERLAELADSEGTRAVNYLRRARKAEKVLRELVSLEDMRLRLRNLHEIGHGTDYTDYHRLLPLAWAAARDVLGRAAQPGRQCLPASVPSQRR